MQEEYSGAIYIVGPRNEDGYKQTLEFLNAKFTKVVVIGDGTSDLIDKNGEGAIGNTTILSQNYPELLNEGRFLVYIEIHGTVTDNKHVILVNKEESLFCSQTLFKVLAETIKNPIDIIFMPCHGKAALMDIEVLPLNSRVMIFSDADKNTAAPNILIALDGLQNSKFTLDNFYNNYLARIFLMDESPTISIIGRETIDPIALNEIYLGRAIDEVSRQYVHNHFGRSVCENDMACHNRIDYLMNKIEHSSSINEFRVTASESYFTALSEYSQMKIEYNFNLNSKHEKIVSYSCQALENCYIEILELKNKIDQLLLEYKIPLELDLSCQSWYELDYEYDADEEGSERLSDLGIYHFIKYDGFIKNNNFSITEYEEYGYVLGIIKDIYLFQSQYSF